jgi:hypothetical protein
MTRQPIDPISPLPRPEAAENGGRPTGLTDQIAARILTAIRIGAHQGPAAAFAGVPAETMSRWMHRDGEPYESFQQKVREAESFAEVKAIGIVTSSKEAKDALGFLERRFPKRWARVPTQAVSVTFDLGQMLDKIEERRADPRAPRDPRPPLRPGAPRDPRPPLVIEHEPTRPALPEPRPKREPVRPPRTPVR